MIFTTGHDGGNASGTRQPFNSSYLPLCQEMLTRSDSGSNSLGCTVVQMAWRWEDYSMPTYLSLQGILLHKEGFEEPLSPSDTFLGHPFDPEFEETNAVMDLSHWMHHLNQILEHLWRQWRSEYLVGLRESHAYCGSTFKIRCHQRSAFDLGLQDNKLHPTCCHLQKLSQSANVLTIENGFTLMGTLILVSAIYDPALYVTDEEVFRRTGMYVNVQAIVERPELHIIGRSTSSIEDQRKFIECRRQCMQQMGTKLFTSEGLEITDVLRFFHGDGPAQQFEAGHSIGGNYCCVGCGARSTLFDDIVHCYRSPKLSFKDRQEFVLKGASWEKNNATPFDGLSIEQLRVELARRCIDIKGKKRPQLDKDFEELKMGIVSVPALLQTNPTESLESLNLVQYEVSPLEPLHDIKGHFSNVIEESICIAPEGVKTELHKIQAAVLSKDTLRGCDYRKAMILMYLKTKEIQPDSMLCKVFQTAVQISKILYASEAKRTPKSILNLHNIAFYHAYLCAKLFLAPKHMTRRKLFGRYFHALTTHSPLLYRIICLRSLNTEIQERMFSQVKQISKTTSNQSTDNIVTNAIKRLHYEEDSKHEDTIAVQESEIEKLAKVTGPFTNTCFTIEIMKSASYQSHIERISDYLVCGPGVWWKTTNDGVEFFDGDFEDDYRDVGPTMHHFRSSSLVDIDALLLEQWEQCITENIQLPASLHSGKGSGFFDKAVMATRLVPTHKASGTLGEWS
eukprot:Em0005g322a